MTGPIALPATSFAKVAVELTLIAHREAGAVAAMEVYVARFGGAANERTLADARASAEMTGELAAFFRALIPYEQDIRAAVAALATSLPSTEERVA